MRLIKIIFFGITSLGLLHCGAQNKGKKNLKQVPMDTIAITRDSEKFDLGRYEQLKDKQSNTATQKLSSGTYIEMHKAASGASYRETRPYSYFTLLKLYYPNGNIQAKGLYFNVSWGGFRKGIWYQFDENGKFVKEVDYDAGYQFTFDDILAFCKKQNIPLTVGPVLQSTGYHTSILRNTSTSSGKKEWMIRWLKKEDVVEEITLDGDTGAITQKRESSYTNN